MELDYRAIFKELNDSGLDYIVIGGVAVNFHGVPRMTYDIDLMVLLEKGNIIKAVAKLTDWGYRPRVPVNPEDLADESMRDSWIRDKGIRALTFYNDTTPIAEIDLVFDIPFPYDELRSRAVFMDLEGVKVPVISIQDLIELKLHTGRKQDLADVKYLKAIMEKK